MLFRPSFCANCGEKIERAEWYIWTSRRFCQVCESEFKGQDLIPRAIVGGGILLALFGFGSFLGSGPGNGAQIYKQPITLKNQPGPTVQSTTVNSTLAKIGSNSVDGQPDRRVLPSTSGAVNEQTANLQNQQLRKTESIGTVYFCGAATKKGTPCSRRVKGNTRCFQHTGMPAILPADKLRVS